MKPHIHVINLGSMPYQEAWRYQEALQQALIARKRGTQTAQTDNLHQNDAPGDPHSGSSPTPSIPTRSPSTRSSDPSAQPDGYLLFVEHPHVYTIGKSGDWNNLLFTGDILRQKGIEVVKTDRGGDITYHGPGQLVGYPVLDLERFNLGVAGYIEALEEVIMRTAAHFGITAQRIEGRTGVWVKNNKLCAIGIKCSRYVCMHGFALNVRTDLDYYNGIIPCGINDGGVTSFEKLLNEPVSLKRIKSVLIPLFLKQFNATAGSSIPSETSQSNQADN
ncbi:lipoyl(octanoyl) transferase LipB [Balneolales bacterium ANBcel1]|nr:lipoyl(octanoyl) transferase LipB [Balneolales bacterium ANBcel1]